MKKTITLCFILFAFFVKAQDTLNLKFFIEGYYAGGGTTRTGFDSTTVRLRNPLSSCQYVFTPVKGIFLSNGTMKVNFPSAVSGNSYYIEVAHCGANVTMSKLPVLFASITNYDFTTAQSQAFGNNQVQVDPGVWAFYSGDINQDQNIDLIDFPPMDFAINSGICSSNCADLNADGNVDLLDFPVLCRGISLGIFGQVCKP